MMLPQIAHSSVSRRFIALLAYSTSAVVSFWLAFTLRWGFDWPEDTKVRFAFAVPLFVAITLLSAISLRLSTGRWRFIGISNVVRLDIAAAITAVLFALLTGVLHWPAAVPINHTIVATILNVNIIAAMWLSYRYAYERKRASGLRNSRRVVIVGAGDAGSMLVREMLRGSTGYQPIGFVDDEPRMRRASIHGVEVLGSTERLPAFVRKLDIQEIIIAIPSAEPPQLRRIVELCETADVPYKVLPGIASVLSGRVDLSQLRNVRIEDLLGREPISLELPQLAEDLRGRSVLITGAAGSIGSELARQVALHDPGILILFDQAETPLFYLEQELRENHPDQQMVFLVGDVVDSVAVERLFHDYAPSRVYHAAAYKHVPMMQSNPREAIRNNVTGTYLVAAAAGRHETEKFVLVSTDKAVRPTSTMGATKRLAEIAMQDLQTKFPNTCYSAVRFGNVLGSNGSVLPIFKQQIEAGKPLTVTHPEVTRYFMTIPEAVHLILQTTLIENMHGCILMLEMGEPVKIVDLARNLLRLSGQAFGSGKGMVFTGLRRGEKLHEELTAPDETTAPTAISRVKLVHPSQLSISNLPEMLAEWEQAYAEGRDSDVVASLTSLFKGLHYRSDSGETTSMKAHV